jgi:hypothetical protein
MPLPVGINQTGEHVVLPTAIDKQIVPGNPFDLKAKALQHIATAVVVGHIAGHHAVQVEIVNQSFASLSHHPLPLVASRQPIAQGRPMEGSANNGIEVDDTEMPSPTSGDL